MSSTGISRLALALVASVSLASCSSTNADTTDAESTTTMGVTSEDVRWNQMRSWVLYYLNATRDPIEKYLKSKGKSLYSGGQTPSTIADCALTRFKVNVFPTLPSWFEIDSRESANELLSKELPPEALLAWFTECS